VYFVRRPKKEDLKTPKEEETIRQRPRSRTISLAALVALLVNLLLILSVLVFAVVPELTATVMVTIVPRIEQLTLTSTLQIGKLLSPITLSQSQTIPTTGHGHQDAHDAVGTLTFYNGLSTVQSVAAGTVITGNDGVHVATDAAVTIPPANPPSLGETSVTTHAIHAGASGNIQAKDINTTLSIALYVKNLAPFTGGQDERNYMVVTKQDRDSAAATLKAKVAASMTAALQGQLTPTEQLQSMPCFPTITADHGIGDEATQIYVSVSETCTAIAYNTQELAEQATKLLSSQAAKTVGTDYMLYGGVKVSVTQAKTTQPQTIILSFTCQGTYVYQLNGQGQQRIKILIAGKPSTTALRLLSKLPGIHQVSISGIPDNKSLPDDLSHIHLLLLIEG
jgi:hypothetical protein